MSEELTTGAAGDFVNGAFDGAVLRLRGDGRKEWVAPERQLPQFDATPVQATPMAMLAMAVQNGADIAKMEQLMQLAERWEANEARKAFVAAMAEFKASPPEIFKDKRVGFESKRTGSTTSYTHATIGNVVEKIVEGLARHGISHRWSLEQNGPVIRVTCVLTHRLGHSEEVKMEGVKDDSGQKNPIQQVASTISYLQRYTLLSATGLATKDQTDNDGRSERKAAGTVSDPFEKTAPDESQETQLWQELAPTAWREVVHGDAGGQSFGEIADVPDGDKLMVRMWASNRQHPAICAWAAGWITRTMAKLGIVWPSGLPESEAGELPDDFNDLNAAGLWAVAASVRKLQIAAAKKETP